MSAPKTDVVYRGPSMLDGKPIVGLVSYESSNIKTGPMAQLWILPARVEPHKAQKSGQDASVCGLCPQRPALGGGCYVVTFQGPLSVWRGAKGKRVNVKLALANLEAAHAKAEGSRAVLRLGAYGDPAALPASLLDTLAWAVNGKVTGYTHQWRTFGPLTSQAVTLKQWCMASVESERDAFIAQKLGWRTFRVHGEGEALMHGEVTCLNTTRGLQCRDCGICDGASRSKNVAIEVHGFRKGKAPVGA